MKKTLYEQVIEIDAITNQLYKDITEEVKLRNGLIRIKPNDGYILKGTFVNDMMGVRYEEEIVAISVFDGLLAILRGYYDEHAESTDEELLDSDKWVTVCSDKVVQLSTLYDIAYELSTGNY